MYKIKFKNGCVENISDAIAKELIKRAFCADEGNGELSVSYCDDDDVECLEHEIRYVIDQMELEEEIYKHCIRGIDPFAMLSPSDLMGDDEE